MEYLHAPWRIEYILAEKPPPGEESLFTRIANSPDDIANHVLLRTKTCYVVLNTYPYNGGHLMVVPYKQTSDFNDLTETDLAELMLVTRRCVNALKRAMEPDGFNIGMNLGRVAGAGVEDHLHIHVVPRWNGDTNFMPVLGETSVVPEALKETATRLREAFHRDDRGAVPDHA
jgi:ATP adenylyltransferase